MTDIDFRCLSWNINRDVYNNGTAQAWGRRKGAVVKVLRESRCSVLLLQECSYAQAAYICAQLGKSWTWQRDRNHNVVAWDGALWKGEKVREWKLAGSQSRSLLAIKLRRIGGNGRGRYVWAASSHLSSGDKASRDAQAKQIVRLLGTYQWIVLGIDLNNGLTNVGPRATFTKSGWTGIITSAPEKAKATFTAYTKSAADDQVLDDVWTKTKWVSIRWSRVTPVSCSDHNPLIFGPRVHTKRQKR